MVLRMSQGGLLRRLRSRSISHLRPSAAAAAAQAGQREFQRGYVVDERP